MMNNFVFLNGKLSVRSVLKNKRIKLTCANTIAVGICCSPATVTVTATVTATATFTVWATVAVSRVHDEAEKENEERCQTFHSGFIKSSSKDIQSV